MEPDTEPLTEPVRSAAADVATLAIEGSVPETVTRCTIRERTFHDDAGHRGLAWTGERALPWQEDLQVVYEHYHRYLLASAWVTNKDVLDLGSGEGYGADLLARTARSVVGVDIAREAVEHARRRYGRDHVTFVQGSMIDTSSIEPDSCDVVVCFEALEHVVEHQELLAVVHKALRPGGLFVTSTPEPTAYNEDRSHGANPYHVGELTRAELAALLSDSFAHVTMLDQRIAVGSLVTSAGPGPAQTTALAREGDGWIGVPTPPATYLLAVASDGDLPVVPTVSVLVDPELELVRGVQRRWYDVVDALKVKDERLAEATALADRRAADSRVNADVLRAELATLQAELVRARTQAREANEELSRLRQRVDRLRGSRVYRGYRALRAGVSTFRTGAAVI